jgi:hypothetical protein
MIGWLLVLPALAFPHRHVPARTAYVVWTPGHDQTVLIVKLAEGRGLFVEDGQVTGPGDLSTLNRLLLGAEPRFGRDPAAIRADRATYDPEHRLADLALYLRIRSPDAAALGTRLLANELVEHAFLAPFPVEPPVDLPPTTPDLSNHQGYIGAAPDGLGFDEAWTWPGGRGENVAIADLEYGWSDSHEDLEATLGVHTEGWDSGYYPCHGTGVLGELVAGDNGYGVTGMVPAAEPLVVFPYQEPDEYDIAASVEAAAAVLDRGDVLLIEQQAYIHNGYAPVEVYPDVWDAISLAVAKGIVVVEPGGNGSANLDDPIWEGWFDRQLRDSGAILVGGGASPGGYYTAREWYPNGSSYGERMDVQGWYDSIATTGFSTSIDPYCTTPDLFFPDGDPDQAYTGGFGGTSGAAPMIAAAAAVANSVAWELWGTPWDPMDLRAALVSTGTPQVGSGHKIGPQPDLRQLLWTWAVR